MQSGVLKAIAAYLIWGLYPLYFKSIRSVPPLELMLHRLVWSFVFLVALMTALRQWRWLATLRHKPRVLIWFTGSALLLSLNWYLYVWAVNNGHILDASLGYFIGPLVNVLLGYVFFKERLRPAQWSAVALAVAGVLWLSVQGGHLPWISLALALSFSTYGLMRKSAELGALEGLTLETILLFPFGVMALLFIDATQGSAFVAASTTTQWLLAASGPVTAIPLLLFAAAARRISLSLLGMIQYVGPSLQFMLGVLVFHEPFDHIRLIGFIAIWAALVLYSLEGLWHNKRSVAPELVSKTM